MLRGMPDIQGLLGGGGSAAHQEFRLSTLIYMFIHADRADRVLPPMIPLVMGSSLI